MSDTTSTAESDARERLREKALDSGICSLDAEFGLEPSEALEIIDEIAATAADAYNADARTTGERAVSA